MQDIISSPVKMQNQTLSRPDITYAVSQFNLQRSYEASYYSFQDDC